MGSDLDGHLFPGSVTLFPGSVLGNYGFGDVFYVDTRFNVIPLGFFVVTHFFKLFFLFHPLYCQLPGVMFSSLEVKWPSKVFCSFLFV